MEIVSGEDVRGKLLSGVNKAANAVLATMGPYGKTIILTSATEPSYITKDGVSVIRRIQFKDPVENTAAELLLEVAEKTVDLVGDGTTTAICLASQLINLGFGLIEDGVAYLDVKKAIELIEKETLAILKEGAKEIKYSDIIDVATISANNDVEIGELITDAYNHSHLVKVYQGSKEEDVLELVDGMELETSYFDKAFLNNMEKQSIEYDTSFKVIIVDGKLDDLACIAGLLDQGYKDFVIIADHFSHEVNSLLKTNYNRNALRIVPIKSPGFGQHRRDLLSDIATYTGAELLDPNKRYSDIIISTGDVNTIEATKDKVFFTTDGNEAVEEKIKSLKTYAKSLEKGYDKDITEKRIDMLSSKTASIYVGGVSELEMKERYDRTEDAVKAVGSALEEGIVEGGGIALVRAYNALCNNKDINQDLLAFLMHPSFVIFTNSNHTINKSFEEDRFKMKIVDPLKVTRTALQNAVSVATTILGTEALVLNPDLW